jgi:hypothetical protein
MGVTVRVTDDAKKKPARIIGAGFGHTTDF